MTAFTLKLIAIISMIFDHSSFLIYGSQFSWMRCIGRIAFPIFAFQISEGYIHTHNLKKYYLKLLIFALLSEIPYLWFTNTFLVNSKINIIFTLILGLLSINIYDYANKASENKNGNMKFYYKFNAIALIILISILAWKLNFDYGYYGVLLVFLFYILRKKKLLMNISMIILTTIFFLPNLMASSFHRYYIILTLCTFLPLIFISLYNGKKGKNYKLSFYIFYPVHFIVLCLINFFIH